MMKKLLTLFLFTAFSFSVFAQMAENADIQPGQVFEQKKTVHLEGIPSHIENTEALLYDNGPLITHPAQGCSGGDASVIEAALTHTLFGWGANKAAAGGGYFMADDFTTTETWTVESLKFFAYQTGATALSITGVYVQIWNGAPNAGGTVVWGDTTTNRMVDVTLSNIYRATGTDIANCTRRIQTVTASCNAVLPPGTYWVQWGFTGSLASGPWQPPVTIVGQAVTGNALQKSPNGWANALNGTTHQNGAPFMIYGTAGSANPIIYEETFDGDNTPAGLAARGWLFVNNDGGGTTTAFNGTSITPFQGASLVNQNYQGANGFYIDQWLISPEITVSAGDTLSFWHQALTGSWDDSINVRISNGDTALASFTLNLGRYKVNQGSWARYTYVFPTGGAKRVAIHYHMYDAGASGTHSNYWGMDLFQILSGSGGGPTILFADDFESYTAGLKLAQQAPTVWTTWSNAPGGSEDAEVTTEQAYGGTKSVKVVYNNDLVKDFGTAFSTGKYKISFFIYIPTGKAAYFNTLASFAGSSSQWGLEVYFDVGGGGRVNPNGSVPATFQWTAATWHKVEHVVDLDNNLSQFYVNNNLVHTQVWTLGAYTTAISKTLDANDFYGATINDLYYIDNYVLEDMFIIPVEFTAFAATQNGSKIDLNWSTATETNNHGFEVERRIDDGNWTVIGFKQGAGTTTNPTSYSFTDDISTVSANSIYYRLKQIDFDGKFEYSNEILVDNLVPTQFAVSQNYPNPFNPVTTIKYQLPANDFVSLKVYNTLGEEVKTLVNGMVNAGTHEVSFNAEGFASGVYFYIIRVGQDKFVQSMKMVLMK